MCIFAGLRSEVPPDRGGSRGQVRPEEHGDRAGDGAGAARPQHHVLRLRPTQLLLGEEKGKQRKNTSSFAF